MPESRKIHKSPARKVGILNGLPPESSQKRPSIALVILLLAGLLRRSANLTYNTRLGLSSIAWTIIARLGADGPMTQTELADRYLLDKGQLSRTAVELADLGLLVREKRDWRTIELSLSAQGRKTYASIVGISNDRHRALAAGLTDAELRNLYRTLDKITINASALLNQVMTREPPEE